MTVTDETLLDVPAAAERLGVSKRMLWKIMSTHALPFVKIGRSRRLEPEALREYVARNRFGGRDEAN